GAVLYQILAGVTPHAPAGASSEPSRNVAEVLGKVVNEPPVSLEARDPTIPRDLRMIAHRALARRPDDRYADAGELAAGLRRYQTGQLVSARHYGSFALTLRWLRRYRAWVVATVLVIASLVGGIVVSRRAQRQAEQRLAQVRSLANKIIFD